MIRWFDKYVKTAEPRGRGADATRAKASHQQ